MNMSCIPPSGLPRTPVKRNRELADNGEDGDDIPSTTKKQKTLRVLPSASLTHVRWFRRHEDGSAGKLQHTSRFLTGQPDADHDISPAPLCDFDRFLEALEIRPEDLSEKYVQMQIPGGGNVRIKDSVAWRNALDDIHNRLRSGIMEKTEPVWISHMGRPTMDGPDGGDVMMIDVEDVNMASDEASQTGPPLDDEEFWHHWPKVCEFFLHDREVGHSSGVRLPELTQPLSPASMIRIYRSLSRFELYDTSALSKTEKVQLMCIVALCWDIFDRCKQENHDMIDIGNAAAWAVERKFGLQCACRPGSFTMSVTMKTVRGPHLILAKDYDAARGWIEMCRSCFTVDAASSGRCMLAAWYQTRQLALQHPTLGPETRTLLPSDLLGKFDLGRRSPGTVLTDGMTMRELRADCDVRPFLCEASLTLGGAGAPSLSQGRVVLIINCDEFDIGGFDETFSTRLAVPRRRGNEPQDFELLGCMIASTCLVQGDAGLGRSVRDLVANVCFRVDNAYKRQTTYLEEA